MTPELSSVRCKYVLAFSLVLGVAVLGTPSSQAQTFSIIHNFAWNDGANPLAGLAIDSNETLYGTTSAGGSSGYGVVFAMNLAGSEKVLYNFTGGADGASPQSSLILDSLGNLYGSTYSGGTYGAGTVFEVTKGGKEKVLYSFTGGTDGASPIAGLAMDSTDNLYGTTFGGGAYGGGTVFEVTKGGKEKVLYSFGQGADGADPVAGVTLGTKGTIFGTTSTGGTYGYGIIFQLSPSSSGWRETVLHTFEMESDGGTPYAGLVFDQSGNLYGGATSGGDGGGGTIFELTPSGAGWNFTVLYGLVGWDVSGPFRNLMVDSSGTIYGTTHCDGTGQAGTAYELTQSGSSWTYNSLYVFSPVDGYYVYSNLVFDKRGNLYGTASVGAGNNYGAVFKVTP
jgi:uncharacterized repeat protein (TIGR03803 family)